MLRVYSTRFEYRLAHPDGHGDYANPHVPCTIGSFLSQWEAPRREVPST